MDELNNVMKGMIFRTLYIDKKLDDKLRDKALEAQISRNDLIRFCLDKGLTLENTPIKLNTKNKKESLVLRSADISTHAEDIIRTMAFDLKIVKNDLVRQYLAWGFDSLTNKEIKLIQKHGYQPKKNSIQTKKIEKNTKVLTIDSNLYKKFVSYMKKNNIVESEDSFFNSVLKLGLAELKKLEKEKELPRSSVNSKIKTTVK